VTYHHILLTLPLEVRAVVDSKEQQRLWQRAVAKAWADEDYKKRLLADPACVLQAAGLIFPEGVGVNVVEATKEQIWFVLPMQQADDAVVGEERLAACL
jgi:hypothetical protein